jgi:glycine oxidase
VSGERFDVVIVGGGIIGLSTAWRAARRGLSVAVLERERVGAGASSVAAGMLAPASEAEFGTAAERHLELGLRSAGLWPDFAVELERESGAEVELARSGTLMLARDGDEARELERVVEHRRSLGLDVERVLPSEARAREPGLAPCVRMGLAIEGDRAVDPRQVLAALRQACERAGVRVREGAPVAEVLLEGSAGPARGVLLAGGEPVGARAVVVAAGAWSDQLAGLPAQERVPVRPVKGQTVRLRDPDGPGLATHVLRFGSCYVVPRSDGRYLLGGTVEERGFDSGPTAGAAYEMLRQARELLPGILELQIEELDCGLRPGSPDNAPALGELGVENLLWATGHYRNGILLAPLTASLLSGVLAARLHGGSWEPEGVGPDPETAGRLLATYSPARFAAAAQAAGDAEAVGVPR